ncbi:phage portal protein [Kitasatospora sp. NPDC059646]|uniref:phage portal protein n=1 Tax=Kitasatospora sp. NPDC059646 TaxID=3346893 RepID=UPI0036D18FFD
MAIDASKPQSPGWWLARLGNRILGEREALDKLWNYAVGRPPLPTVPGVDPTEAHEWMKHARTNWLGLVIDSTTERLGVDGFRFGADGQKAADAEANRIWQENHLDADSDLVHYGALAQRRAFVLVEKGPDGRPVLTHETPRQVAVEYEQGSRRKLAAGLKLWRDDWTGQTKATLWLPQGVYYFATKQTEPSFVLAARGAELRQWDADTLPGTADGTAANPLGVVPLVGFTNRRNRRPDGFAEHEDLLANQDRINAKGILLMAAMRYGAFKQRTAAGLVVDEDPLTGKKITPFQLDMKSLWTTDDPNVKFGEFSSTDVGPYIRAIEAATQDLAAISRTPPHYLIGAVVNVSGDALKAAETGLVSKVRDRQRNFGESWEQVMRLAFRALGDEQRAAAYDAETVWRDPESRSLAELADAAVKLDSAGVPWRARMERLQYTPPEIDRMEIDRAQDALLQPAAPEATATPIRQPAPTDPRAVIGRAADVPQAA